MFGYINPLLADLNENDISTIKKYYCGLCISIKNKFGNIPRLTLNYDAAFVAIFLDSISIYEPSFKDIVCLKHPLSTRNISMHTPQLDYSSDFNILSFYFKIIDDINDDNNIKSKIVLRLINPYIKKITYPFMKNIFIKNLSLLSDYEKKLSDDNIDVFCHPFSNLIGEIFESVPFEISDDTKSTRNNLFQFGYLLGKWIYLIDALDDLKSDITKNKFNPINFIYNKNNDSYEKIINKIKEPMDFILMTLASNCSSQLDKIPLKRNKTIIINTISHGLIDNYMNIFSKL